MKDSKEYLRVKASQLKEELAEEKSYFLMIETWDEQGNLKLSAISSMDDFEVKEKLRFFLTEAKHPNVINYDS